MDAVRAVLTALLLAASLSLTGGARLPASPSAQHHDTLSAVCGPPAMPVVARRAGDPERPGLALALAHLEHHDTWLIAPCATRAPGPPAPRTLRRPTLAHSPQSPRAPPSVS